MTDLANLVNVVRGKVTLPADAEFAQAHQAWNLAVDQSGVLAVVEAADADDIAALVRFARERGLAIITQPTGHGAGHNVDGAILLRTKALDSLEIDADRRVAKVGAGVKWGAVLKAASPHGLTGLAGSSPVVGVTGYTLAGGMSWFGRKFGAAADSVLAFEIVDAEGAQRTVDAQSDPDLFAALRGAGGDFAIVTALEFQLHPAPELFGGKMLWPGEKGPEVFAAFREVTAEAPDELSLWFNVLAFPGAPTMVAVDLTFLGSEVDGRKLLAAFDAIDGRIGDTRAVLPISELGTITGEPENPTPGASRTELLTDVGPEVQRTLLAPLAPVFGFQLRHLGGALRGWLDADYSVFMLGAPTPDTKAKFAEIVADLGIHVTGRKPFVGLGAHDSITKVFDEATVTRLRELKKTRDPQGVFRSNHPVLD